MLQGVFQEISSKFLPFRVWKQQFFMKLLLQMHPKTFLEVVWRHPRYLEGAPTSGDYNAPTPMVIRPTNHFLFKKEVNPPQWLAVLETASLSVKLAAQNSNRIFLWKNACFSRQCFCIIFKKVPMKLIATMKKKFIGSKKWWHHHSSQRFFLIAMPLRAKLYHLQR